MRTYRTGDHTRVATRTLRRSAKLSGGSSPGSPRHPERNQRHTGTRIPDARLPAAAGLRLDVGCAPPAQSRLSMGSHGRSGHFTLGPHGCRTPRPDQVTRTRTFSQAASRLRPSPCYIMPERDCTTALCSNPDTQLGGFPGTCASSSGRPRHSRRCLRYIHHAGWVRNGSSLPLKVITEEMSRFHDLTGTEKPLKCTRTETIGPGYRTWLECLAQQIEDTSCCCHLICELLE